MGIEHGICNTDVVKQYGDVWEIPDKTKLYIPDNNLAIQLIADGAGNLLNDLLLIDGYIYNRCDYQR
ncbi:hypothetical protein A4D02_21080 [Niastella koreensis]|uniref:Uncharacterized protein n=1 Tax=Niastella koreensis TaxID=354356 RepID=A0ABX3P3D0_9BACT|nr:hypothetical protein A4D02_21080 [Niastella koreensis]